MQMATGAALCALIAWQVPLSAEFLPPGMIAYRGGDAGASAIRVARQLCGADGIAVDPTRDHIYIAEEYNHRVVRIERGGSPRAVIDSETPVFSQTPDGPRRAPPLRAPEGLAWCPRAGLYVAEDAPGGRLLLFTPTPDGRLPRGEVVDLKLPDHSFAWESLDVAPNGALLLCGSSAEGMASDNAPAVSVGIVLYRDSQGQWWNPLRRPFASFSAVCFDPTGDIGYVACEWSGALIGIDLTRRDVRLWVSRHTFDSPEGMVSLPDGSLLLAEERGIIRHIDPAADHAAHGIDLGTAIESLAYDVGRSRLFVTADEAGECLALQAPATSAAERAGSPAFERHSPSPLVPSICPEYLTAALRRAGYDPHDPRAPVNFATLARRLSIVAVDAIATLMQTDRNVEDPITRVQFAALAPNLMGFDLSAFTGPVGAFAAVRASGRVVKTTAVSKRMLRADALAGTVSPIGPDTIPVPYPAGARLSPEGIASLHWHGLGHSPDYALVLNTFKPDENYLMETDIDGEIRQYRLSPPAGASHEQWVVAIRPADPEPWMRLDAAPHLLAETPLSRPRS